MNETHQKLKSQLNQKYTALCSHLADCNLKLEKLQEQIQNLKSQISSTEQISIMLDSMIKEDQSE